MRYMLIQIYVFMQLRIIREQVFIRLREHNPQELCISSVTYAELVHGVEKKQSN